MRSRIQKVLSSHGLASRRKIESLIIEGRIQVNGKNASLGQLISSSDKVKFDGKEIFLSKNANQQKRVLIYNKKIGEISSSKDKNHRNTIFDSLPKIKSGRWVSVGRLDINTSGLILFTNNGELSNRLMHPSSNIEREYVARINGKVDDKILKRLVNGVNLEDGFAKFTDIQEGRKGSTNQWFAMVITEGRTREVRRLWESQGLRVSRLKRVRFGNVFLPSGLKGGAWKELSQEDVLSIEHL